MTPETRHRLVGLVLLGVIGAILSSLLFRSPDQVRVALDLDIPDPPRVARMDLSPPVTERQLETAREEIRQAAEDVVVAAEEQPRGESLPASGTSPAAWAVQVASFAEARNAEALAVRLRNAGYSAYVRDVEADGRVLHRVLLGPGLSRADAERTRERVRADVRFKLQGLVVPWSL